MSRPESATCTAYARWTLLRLAQVFEPATSESAQRDVSARMQSFERSIASVSGTAVPRTSEEVYGGRTAPTVPKLHPMDSGKLFGDILLDPLGEVP